MNKLIILLCFFIFSNFNALGQLDRLPSKRKLKNKYADFINEDEKLFDWGYHFTKTKVNKNKYIQRTFFPETKVKISEVVYNSKAMKKMNGLAKYWYENGNRRSEGFHINNEKVGEWKHYNRFKETISSKGICKADKREGVWEFYDTEGRIKSKVNYTKGKQHGEFIEYDTLGIAVNSGLYENGKKVVESNPTDEKDLDEDALYLIAEPENMPYFPKCATFENFLERNECTKHELLNYVFQNFNGGDISRKYNITGTMISQFTISKTGEVTDIDVIVGLNQELKDELERVISEMPDWVPATKNGKNVNLRYILPIKLKTEQTIIRY